MRRMMRIIPVLAGIALLAGTLSACDEKEDGVAQSPPAQSQEESPAPEPAEEASDPEETEAPAAEPAAREAAEEPEAEEPQVLGEDPATMEDDHPDIDHNAVVVDYETLPGDCHNDVPLPDSQHGVVSTTQDDQGECVIVIDSRGDSLYMAQDIAAQLSALGFFQTSVSPPDNGENAINVVSYLTKTHEVYVTVQQDGVSGVMITYALIDKLRGNG